MYYPFGKLLSQLEKAIFFGVPAHNFFPASATAANEAIHGRSHMTIPYLQQR
jgi:hypothetical protein